MDLLVTHQISFKIIQDLFDLFWGLAMVMHFYLKAVYHFFVPIKPKSLTGKVILVTGSASGIGREVCLKLAKTGGVILVCWDVDKTTNDKLVKELVACTGVRAYSYHLDVSDRLQVKSVIQAVRKDVGDIHVVINNAGVMYCNTFLNQSSEPLEKSFRVNIFSQFWILQEVLPRMIELNDGHIVTMCSAAGVLPCRNLAAYSATKHAVHGFIEALKEEIRFDRRNPNIHFTTVYPFTCSTGLISGIKTHSRFPSIIDTIKPEDVADKLVNGLCRNYEHVYVPDLLKPMVMIAKILPPEHHRLAKDYFNCYIEPCK